MKKTDCIAPLVFIAASIHLLISGSVRAEVDLIKKLDLDSDGEITIKEAVADPVVLASFGKIDTDGNGKISLIELSTTKVDLVHSNEINKSES